ncbi:MAG: site-2 protease family protein [Deltaproteobacteria bacterium]|nr:site-2 protease family protein [Deltaproteobacteria bacterium]
MPDNQGILLHPAALAGWIGFLMTCVNLLPIGQLDGGHVAFALFGRSNRAISITIIVLLLIFGIFIWHGWLFSALLVTILCVRHRHPSLPDEQVMLGWKRKLIGWFSIVVFVLTFLPSPICHGRFAELKAVMGCKCKMGVMHENKTERRHPK